MREPRSRTALLAVLVVAVAFSLPAAASRADARGVNGPALSTLPSHTAFAQRPHPYTFIIVARHSVKCLEVADASVDNGANVVQRTCDESLNQQWSFLYLENNRYLMVARHSHKCLEVADASLEDGANVVQSTCNGGANQQWSFYHVGGNSYLAVARHSHKCLEVADASLEDGANVDQWTCDGGTNQQWSLGY
ncbi:RICIN domain-containing protein [Kutzneria buriramensis]|uniref:Ricin-type beta-trefoil lectin protein n=1 Tax=Kutzneria buriramensis TaxID=1045776 RepID=A0A3E0I0G8_9PSEU|nr:RICIN domain-containing protein [Kutzneria buriramensis]REH52030.1 ricin-type beta-trefoil lectin protein [Kutzneria buriramensis]